MTPGTTTTPTPHRQPAAVPPTPPPAGKKPGGPILVFVAFFQARNPGPAGIALVALVDGKVALRTCFVPESVTNYHAGWCMIAAAVERLGGRKGVIYTNFAALSGPVLEPPEGAAYALVMAQVRANIGQSKIEFCPNAVESKWLEEARKAARCAFEEGANR